MSGGILVNSHGIVKRSNGIAIGNSGDPCCCAAYMQARKCSDGSLIDIFMTIADATSFPNSFYITADGPGTVYYFDSADAPSSPGTIYAASDATAVAGGCKYKQARNCGGGALVNIWMTAADAALFPGAFRITSGSPSGCYFFFTDGSASPGTVYAAALATAVANCRTLPCLQGCCNITQPDATVSGAVGGSFTNGSYAEALGTTACTIWESAGMVGCRGGPSQIQSNFNTGSFAVFTSDGSWSNGAADMSNLFCIDGVWTGSVTIPWTANECGTPVPHNSVTITFG